MADTLDEEWWLEGNEKESPGVKEEKAKKRKAQQNIKIREEASSMVMNDESKRKKKKRKRTKIETVSTELDGSQTREVLWGSFCHGVSSRLSNLELDDLQIDDSCCLMDEAVHTGKLDDLSGYLNKVIPKWGKDVRRLTRQDTKGSPALLLVTSSAARSVELNRAAERFKGSCKTVKLFAKHMKLDEQMSFLQSHIVHVGVGTPNRILKLIDAESLKTSHLTYVIIDWTWRDPKLRRILDIPEVKEDLWTLMEKFVFPLARSGKLCVGLF